MAGGIDCQLFHLEESAVLFQPRSTGVVAATLSQMQLSTGASACALKAFPALALPTYYRYAGQDVALSSGLLVKKHTRPATTCQQDREPRAQQAAARCTPQAAARRHVAADFGTLSNQWKHCPNPTCRRSQWLSMSAADAPPEVRARRSSARPKLACAGMCASTLNVPLPSRSSSRTTRARRRPRTAYVPGRAAYDRP